MTPSRRQSIEALFHAARERGPSALDGVPEDLRREVETLLAQDLPSVNAFPQDGETRTGEAAEAPAVNPPAALRPGVTLGPYRIDAAIGEGGMGQVFRATDTRLNRTVAIKTSFTQFSDRFRREALAVAALNHANVATLFDVGSDPSGLAYLVLEYIEGPTLADLIRKGPIEPAEACRLALQIAEGLEAAHERGIVHRDLKPANIKLSKTGSVKILDFGLAKALVESGAKPASGGGTTQVGAILGTPAYMSPEQALGGAADLRSDIWSFGVVAAEMLTGKRLFAGKSTEEILGNIVRAEPDLSAIPANWRPLLGRCLTKNARRRLQSIGEARLALEDGLPTAMPVPITARPATSRLPWLAVAAAVAALALIYFWLRPAASAPANPLEGAQFTRITDFEGAELQAEISPDGRFIAFLSDREGPFDIFLTQPGTGRFANLTRDKYGQLLEVTRSTGFSGDGSQIWLRGAISEERAAAPARLMPILGGPPRPFVRAVAVSWSPDNRRIVYHQSDGDPIFIADANGGNPKKIFTDPNPGGHCHFPVWSTDGAWIYFVRGNPTTGEMDLWRIAPSGGAPERMTNRNLNIVYPAPISENTILYASPAEDGSGPWLYSFDVPSRQSRRISFGLEQYTSIAASANGRRLVATVANPSTGLWTIPVQDSIVNESHVKRFPLPGVRALAPRFHGDALYYLSSMGSGDGLWRFANGEAQEIWKGSEGVLFDAPAVSPDGTRIAIVLRHHGRHRLNLLNADGTSPIETAPSLDIRGSVSWSPDGKWIAAGGAGPGGPGLFKIPAGGGEPVQIRKGVSTDPTWSGNGALIAFTGPAIGRERPLLLVTPAAEPVGVPEIRLSLHPGERFRFTPDSRGLVYIEGTLRRQDFNRLDLATKQIRRLTEFNSRASLRTFDFTPDGKRIIFDRLLDNSDIVLIDLPAAPK